MYMYHNYYAQDTTFTCQSGDEIERLGPLKGHLLCHWLESVGVTVVLHSHQATHGGHVIAKL